MYMYVYRYARLTVKIKANILLDVHINNLHKAFKYLQTNISRIILDLFINENSNQWHLVI